ncbi:glycoside hydrolase domain-containing protein [Anaerobium acetethylicum]|nr:glycoside hydrolase domain-containing protein [Anaerobium acetethylicum]
MVREAQHWLNTTYTGRSGYVQIAEDGHTGQTTVQALIRALQIECGATPDGGFADNTLSRCPTISVESTNENIIKIIQYGLWCKGYNAGIVNGIYNENTVKAVKAVETDAGFEAKGIVTPVLFKAILNTDALVLINGGDPNIRSIQQNLNREFFEKFGIMPCDGIYSRQTNKALIYKLQKEEGIPVSERDGIWGPNTISNCPTVINDDTGIEFVKILEYALYCNGYDPGDLSGKDMSLVTQAVSGFQSFMCLDVTGSADKRTLQGLLKSNGDTTRPGTACDASTILNQGKINVLKSNGYRYIGRYLTGTVDGSRSKAMTKEEANLIIDNGLKIFPIYQEGGRDVVKFTESNGNNDALKAVGAAQALGIPYGSTIYFAVDFDCYDYQVTNNIIPYFKSINNRIQSLGGIYKVGIYGPRNACTRVGELHYAVTSFVSDMSTGYSGNLGYRMPPNWAFDQIVGDKLGVGSADEIDIDKDIASGRDKGVGKLDSNVAKLYYESNTKLSGYYWADPIDVSTGAHVISYEAIKVSGEQELAITMNYSSDALGKGSMGIGWYHDFEKHAEKSDEGYKVYQNPSSYLIYTLKEGSLNEYQCNSMGRQNDVLTVNSDGTLTINCNDETTYIFDSTGKLVRETGRNGLEYVISYETSEVRVTEAISGKYVILAKNTDGLVTSISDQAGHTCQFEYMNGSLVKITDVNGKTTTYTYDAAGRVLTGTDSDGICYFRNEYGDFGRVHAQYDGIEGSNPTIFAYDDTAGDGSTVVTITDRNQKQRKHFFNVKRQLTKIIDENGNENTFSYDENGNIASKTDALENVENTVYDSHNRVLSRTDKMNNVTGYTYDSKGNLLKIQNPDGTAQEFTYMGNKMVSSKDTNGRITTYEYQVNGLLSKKTVGNAVYSYTYESGKIKTITAPDGGVTTYFYDTVGNLVKTEDAEGRINTQTVDSSGHVLSTTNPAGGVSTNTYNCRGEAATHTDANGNVTTLAYNGNGKIISKTDSKGIIIRYEYDGEDRLVKTIDKRGKVTGIEYDPAGRVIKETDTENGSIIFEYDAAGNLKKKTSPSGNWIERTYDANGNLLTEKDSAGTTVKYAYDAMNRLTKQTNPQGGETVYEHDASGNIVKITDPLGNITSRTYDLNGNMLTETDPKGNTTTYQYDAGQNLIKATDALGGQISYTYDKCGNRLTVTNANGSITRFEYDGCGRCTAVIDSQGNRTRTEYDANGNVVKTINALGNIVAKTTYNSLNQAVRTEDSLGNGMDLSYDQSGNVLSKTDALGNKTSYGYDGLNRMTTAVNPLNAASSVGYDQDGNMSSMTGPLGGATAYEYDSAGRLSAEKSGSNVQKTYGYNESGLLSVSTNARGQQTGYAYDKAGRVISITDAEGTTTFKYDANGNGTEKTDSTGTVRKTYDKLNRVSEKTDVNNKTIRYTYDAAGNLTVLTYPDQTSVTYSYDSENRMTSATDWNGNKTTYEYDAIGNIRKTIRPDGSILTKEYDAMGRLTTAVDKGASQELINSYEYRYDAAGRLTEEISKTDNVKYQMTYDSLSRVTSRKIMPYDKVADAKKESGTRMFFRTYDLLGKTVSFVEDSSIPLYEENFTYDAACNIIMSEDDGTGTSMAYDNTNNRLTAANTSANASAYTYDPDGNMTSGQFGGNTMNLQYDSRNRLKSAGNCTYTYDADNVRVSGIKDGYRTTYAYDTASGRSQLLMSTGQDGSVTKYVYGAGALISQESSSGYRVFHYDLRGSTAALTDKSGTVTNRYQYSTYGKVARVLGDDVTPFLYNGRDGVMTEGNGLYYMRARYYSPDLMRFTNADILQGSIENSDTMNRYAFVQGNPVSMIDPFGLCAEPGSSSSSSGFSWASVQKGFENAWGGVKDYFGSWSAVDWGHTALDAAGMIPVFGIVFDGANGIWYLAAGDTLNAGLSGAACIPVVGEFATGGKLTVRATSKAISMTARHADEAAEVAEFVIKNSDEVVEGGSSVYDLLKARGIPTSLSDEEIEAANALDLRMQKGGNTSSGIGNPVEVAGLGSTGRTLPNTLNEQMAMQQVLSSPLDGATKLPFSMKDSRWTASEGWLKMQSAVQNADDTKTIIHFLYNELTHEFDDFKFKQ